MNSASIQTRAVREVTAGALPAGNMTVIPWGTAPFKSSFSRGTPDDVSTHGQAEDNPAEDLQVSMSGSGDFRFGIRDIPREEVFRNTFSAAVTKTGSITAVAATNKLTVAGGWGARAAGDLVWVTGLVTNGVSFVGRVASVSGDDLVFSWPTLQDEGPVANVTVADLGQLIFGTSLLSSYYEEWNTKSSKGKKFPGVSATQWDLSMDFPGHWRESFNFVGMLKGERISAQLANGTTAAASRKTYNANTNTGDKGVVGSQMGLRYNGTLLTNAILKSFKLSAVSPKLTEGGAGTLGPQVLSLDGLVTVKVDLKVLRTGTDVDTLMDDAQNPDSEKSLGLGLRDADGKRVYLWIAKLQPYMGDPDGLKRSGNETVDLSYTARYDATDSSLRYATLT